MPPNHSAAPAIANSTIADAIRTHRSDFTAAAIPYNPPKRRSRRAKWSSAADRSPGRQPGRRREGQYNSASEGSHSSSRKRLGEGKEGVGGGEVEGGRPIQ